MIDTEHTVEVAGHRTYPTVSRRPSRWLTTATAARACG
jgi:hypothetical protein